MPPELEIFSPEHDSPSYRYQQTKSFPMHTSKLQLQPNLPHRDRLQVSNQRQPRSFIPCSPNARRHMTKHARPFQCKASDCHVRPSGDRAGLLRHIREVHKLDSQGQPTSKHACPEASCTRHKKGFAEHWNMAQHFRRAHRTGSGFAARQLRSSSPEASESVERAAAEPGAPTTPRQSATEVCEDLLRSQLALLEREWARVKAAIGAVQGRGWSG
ncbi:hypothetical protein MMC15_004033 [Xylographa vitiligo]|nr:hypothetical protein [Xylographa vitiligo]